MIRDAIVGFAEGLAAGMNAPLVWAGSWFEERAIQHWLTLLKAASPWCGECDHARFTVAQNCKTICGTGSCLCGEHRRLN